MNNQEYVKQIIKYKVYLIPIDMYTKHVDLAIDKINNAKVGNIVELTPQEEVALEVILDNTRIIKL